MVNAFLICLLCALVSISSALLTCPMKIAVESGDTVEFAPVFKGLDTTGKTVVISLVSNAQNGIISVTAKSGTYLGVSIPGFRYVSNHGFTGQDQFQWTISNSQGLSDTGLCLIRVSPADPGGRSVIVYVRQSVLPNINSEVLRLKTDLDNEGYAATVKVWPNPTYSWIGYTAADFAALHDSLISEYEKPGTFLAGTILIGNLPGLGGDNSNEMSPYWSMLPYSSQIDSVTRYGYFGRNAAHIWVCKMIVPSNFQVLGDAATLMKRILQANHDYRTGAIRLPQRAIYMNTLSQQSPAVNPRRLLEIWPSYDSIPTPSSSGLGIVDTVYFKNSYLRGGDFFDYITHITGGLDPDCMLESRVPIRVFLATACDIGAEWGFAPEHLLAKNSGCVLAIGTYKGSSALQYTLVDSAKAKTTMRNLLKRGKSWGRAWQESGMMIPVTGFYGDLSLKPLMTPDNLLPAATLSVSVVSGIAPLTTQLTCMASDADGDIANYEWFPEDYDLGRAVPSASGASVTTFENTYHKPYHYKARVDVTDNHGGATYTYADIFVAPKPGDPLRVRCAYGAHRRTFAKYEKSFEYTDSLGRLWYHDQVYYPGTWGAEGEYNYKITGSRHDTTHIQARLFNAMIISDSLYEYGKRPMNFKPISYRVPLADGRYHLRLGWADFLSTASKPCVFDVEVEGVSWRQGVCPYTLVGASSTPNAIKPYVIDTVVLVQDGELNFRILRNAANPTKIFLNNFEILPENSTEISGSGDESGDLAKVTIAPNPFNPAVSISIRIENRRNVRPDGISTLIIDMAGKIVRKYHFEPEGLTNYVLFQWDGTDEWNQPVASGIYLIRTRIGTEIFRNRITLAR